MSKPLNHTIPTKIKTVMNNEIKKALYRESPLATLANKGSDFWKYNANCSLGNIEFRVPVSDMGETVFNETEPAKLLIRWLV